MGQVDSKEDAKMKAAISKLHKMELKDLEAVFMELSSKTDEGQNVIQQPTWLNRDKFAEILGTNEFLIEQLFSAFDRDQNGVIDMQEFVTGMSLCLHGSIKKKCDMLFKVFNLDGDDGIDPKELSLVLTNCLQSAHTVLRKVSVSEGLCSETDDFVEDQAGEAALTSALVDKIVKDAFEKCDVSHTGKLSVTEFANWVHKHPKLINNVFVMQCPKPSQDPGKSNPSFSIDDEGVNESDLGMSTEGNENADECFTVLTGKDEKHSAVKPPTLKDLFSESEPDAANFFDCIGNNSDTEYSNSRSTGDGSTVDPLQSEINRKHMAGENEMAYSGEVGPNLSSVGGAHASEKHQGKADTLLSIALSQGSLHEENDTRIELPEETHDNLNDNVCDVAASNPIPIPSPDCSEVVPVHNDSHPLPTAEKSVEESEPTTSIGVDTVADEIGVECLESIETRYDIPGDSVRSIVDSSNVKASSFWQPSVQIMQLLLQVSAEGTIPEFKTIQPNIVVENVMNDPVKELVEKYLGEQEASKRPFLNLTHIEFSEKGLHQLLENGCWRAALDFTRNYLETHYAEVASARGKNEPLLTPKVVQVWYVRIALLVRLRMFSSAELEISAFNDFESPDLYYQFYPHLYPGQEGSMVPFSFRLLHAEIPQYNNKANITLDHLYSLLTKVNVIHSNLLQGLTESGEKCETYSEKDVQDRLEIWKKRIIQIHYSLSNCFLGMKEYLLAVKLLEKVILLEPSREIPILSAIGRVFLQLGDCVTAQKYFKRISQDGKEDAKTLSMITMNTALTSLTKGVFKDAYQQFLTAVNLDQSNLAACNNAAVCLLFMGKVKEASDILETMVCQSPEKSLHEEILLNLTTVYELETSRALQKKHKLLDLVCKHKGDGFNVQCLKLT